MQKAGVSRPLFDHSLITEEMRERTQATTLKLVYIP
jgi:hypothetical protein